MSDAISLASLMRISERARELQQSVREEPGSRNVSEGVLKPLLETLGWELEEVWEPSRPQWGKPYLTYDARKDVYAGRIGGEPQIVATCYSGSMSPSTLARLIEYAYNKDASWALAVSPTTIKLFHTHENALRSDARISPYWELRLELLAKQQDEVARVLSASAVSRGVLSTLDKDVRGSRRVALPLNRKLFESLKHWRGEMIDRLFRRSAKQANLEEVDFKVNHLLNQIVFIRVAEDRQFGENPYLIEIFNRWMESSRRPGMLLSQLRTLLSEYAQRYQVELFSNGALLQEQDIEDLVAHLIYSLHSPGFPTVKYDFSVIDVDILGTMYEQYLRLQPQEVSEEQTKQVRLMGEVPTIELVPSDRAVGVHYTPTYIVNYIVTSAMRRWASQEGNTGYPRILDMACGSGSFLLATYRWLLQFEESRRGEPLPRHERQQLLTEFVWGVDKDPKAAEICKLNLWLYALEARQSLPNLDQNIKVGDSLIDSHLGQANQSQLLPDTPTSAPISWRRDFASVLQGGGWDIIVGNPPYIRIQKLQGPEKAIYLQQFDVLHGNFDLSLAFVEMALRLLRPRGVAGFIIANSFVRANYASLLRNELVKRNALLGILDFTDQRVFEGTGAYTCILFLGSPGAIRPRMGVVLRLPPCPAAQLTRWELEDAYDDTLVSGEIDLSRLGEAPWVLVPNREYSLREKLEGLGTPLEQLARIFQGFKTGMDSAFVFQQTTPHRNNYSIEVLTAAGKKIDIELEACLPLVKGGDIQRFHIRTPNHWVLFPYKDGKLLPEEELQKRYPQAWRYLTDTRDRLNTRKEAQLGRVRWYAYSFPKSMTFYSRPKILTPDIAPQASFGFDDQGRFAFTGGAAGGYGLVLLGDKVSYEFLLGLLNSQVIDWYVQAIAAQFHGGYFSYERRFVKDAPVMVPDRSADTENITSIVEMVQRTYETSASRDVKTEREYRDMSSMLFKLETELNDAVMELYQLTESEKQLIRESPYWRKANLLRGS